MGPLHVHLDPLIPLSSPLDPIGPLRSPVLPYKSSGDPLNVAIVPQGHQREGFPRDVPPETPLNSPLTPPFTPWDIPDLPLEPLGPLDAWLDPL